MSMFLVFYKQSYENATLTNSVLIHNIWSCETRVIFVVVLAKANTHTTHRPELIYGYPELLNWLIVLLLVVFIAEFVEC